MKKIRVIHCLGKLNTGGAETLVMNILRKIDREKYQFDFLLFDDNKGFYDTEAKKLGSSLYYTNSMSKAGISKYIKEMTTFFKKEKPDVVHSHMDWQGGFIAYAAHKAGIKKIVVHSHANQKMFIKNPLYFLLILVNKILIQRYATNCVACSKEAGESLFYNEFEVILNGIDIEKYVYPNKAIIDKLKNEFKIKNDDIVLGNVGSLSDNKNQAFLIHLFSELRKENDKYRLILVGGGSNKDKLMQMVKNLDLEDSVLFAGVRSEIPEIMHLFDLFLFPSKMEGLGIVAIEAQMSGLKCIVSDSVPKEVDITNQLVHFLPLNENKWVEKIKEIKDQRERIDSRILLNCEYSIENVCNKLVEIYS